MKVESFHKMSVYFHKNISTSLGKCQYILANLSRKDWKPLKEGLQTSQERFSNQTGEVSKPVWSGQLRQPDLPRQQLGHHPRLDQQCHCEPLFGEAVSLHWGIASGKNQERPRNDIRPT